MGLSNFPSPSEGVLPVLVMNTIISVSLLKNMVRSFLQVMGSSSTSSGSASNSEEDPSSFENSRERRVSITRFGSLCRNRSGNVSNGGGLAAVECCVCLCRFKAEEEVSELSCKHFFHKGCLEKWFDNYQHSTCPLCRSIL